MESTGGAKSSKLILAAMIFAVSMTFIDMTIVAIAIPSLQDDLSLSSTGVQWIVNGYLLSLSALFAFGGRLADIAGHRSMVVLGTILILENKANLESTLGAQGIPKAKADQIADSISQGSSSSGAGLAEVAGSQAKQLYAAVQHDFALASRTVFYVMAGVMALAFVVSLLTMPAGKVEEVVEEPDGAARLSA